MANFVNQKLCLEKLIYSSLMWQVSDMLIKKGGVVAYPVIQAYGSLALEANLKVGEAVQGRCSISCVCVRAF